MLRGYEWQPKEMAGGMGRQDRGVGVFREAHGEQI
jgi:hypothetical protein